MSFEKVVALHSGGLDSSAMLFHLKDCNFDVMPLGINYGQRHITELEAAAAVCEFGEFIPYKQLDLSAVRPILAGSSQTRTDIDVPEGHYAEDNMRVTVVPNRNMILLSMAVAYAISQKAQYVAYAAHKGDHDQYPDCRQEFIDALTKAIELCDYEPPKLMAPYAQMTKAEVVYDGSTHNTPFKLTWSCYKGGRKHCGRCGTCVERAEAFALAGIIDPTDYEDSAYWRTVTKTQYNSQHSEAVGKWLE